MKSRLASMAYCLFSLNRLTTPKAEREMGPQDPDMWDTGEVPPFGPGAIHFSENCRISTTTFDPMLRVL